MPASNEEFLSVTQTGKRKGVSRTSVYDAMTSGRLPHTVIGGHYYLKPADVDAWTPLAPAQRKGLPIGGRPRKEPEPVKRGRGRPRKEKEEQAE